MIRQFAVLILLFCMVASSETFKREVCALSYFPIDEYPKGYRDQWIHTSAQLPIEYLGQHLRVYDLSKGWPKESWLQGCRALTIWHPQNAKDWIAEDQQLAFLQWLQSLVHHGLPLLILEEPGFSSKALFDSGPVRDAWLKLLEEMGLPPMEAVQAQIRPQLLDPKNCMGEKGAQVNYPRRWWRPLRSSQAQQLCWIADPSQSNTQAPMIWIGPKGTLAQPGSLLESGLIPVGVKDNEWRRWRIDPIAFFRAALGLGREPRWDISVRLGRRLFFSHVDADGFSNKSSFYGTGERWVTEIYRDSILRQYPDLPVSLSLIGSEIYPGYAHIPHAMERAMELWSFAQVEPSSHTFSHPFVYNSFQEKLFRNNYEAYSVEVPGYQLNWKWELQGNTLFLDSLARRMHKKVELLQWSGNCLPDERALTLAHNAHLLNINGGDSRWDLTYPSMSNLAPMGYQLGTLFQFYAVNTNETIYSDGWTDNFSSLIRVRESWERAGSPRMMKPMNLYYHFYDVERIEGLRALRQLLDQVRRQEIYPIFTSEYLHIAQNFLDGQIEHSEEGHWTVYPTIANSTLRIDATDQLPDLQRSRNLLGYRQIGQSLFLFLQNPGRSEIYLGSPQELQDQIGPYIVQTNTKISGILNRRTFWQAQIWSWADPMLQLAGLAKGHWQVLWQSARGDAGQREFDVPNSKPVLIPLPQIPRENLILKLRKLR